MKIYISGKIANNKDYVNEFLEAERKLKSKGYTVINPVKPLGFTYKEYKVQGLFRKKV